MAMQPRDRVNAKHRLTVARRAPARSFTRQQKDADDLAWDQQRKRWKLFDQMSIQFCGQPARDY